MNEKLLALPNCYRMKGIKPFVFTIHDENVQQLYHVKVVCKSLCPPWFLGEKRNFTSTIKLE